MLSRRNVVAGLLVLLPLMGGADDLSTPGGTRACGERGAEVPLASELGSAGFMQNLAEHPDSIRAVASRLLAEALSRETLAATADCAPHCSAAALEQVVYRVTPTRFLARAEQRDECLRFEDSTGERPLHFGARAFRTVAEINDWVMDFSQGRGADGRELYERCASNCSPRYTFLIAAQDTGYEVMAEVRCGLTRDKSDNRYRISTALRRTCPVN